jgi:16S rRNA (uracil1498-N3)-methyltransferase
MARRLFFVPEVRGGEAELNGADAEHLVRVLRAEPGEVYEISDNNRAYVARIETARKASIVFRVMEELPAEKETAVVHLFPALFKFDRLEWMIEKATELGAANIELFSSSRSERGLVQAAPKRIERWRRIALEASQQARRRRLPEIGLQTSLESVIKKDFELRLLLDESTSAPPLLSVLGSIEKSVHDRIGILLGPEGGWTEAERQTILASGWKAGSLGSKILRAETAAIAALSAVNVLWTR